MPFSSETTQRTLELVEAIARKLGILPPLPEDPPEPSVGQVVKSIGTSSRDYSTITLWEADLDNDTPYDAGDDAIGECYNDSAFDESVTINGGGVLGLNSVRLTAAAGHRHTGVAGTGARIVASAARTVLLIPLSGSDKLIVSWLEIDGNEQVYASNAALINNVSATAGRIARVRNLLLHGMRTSSANISLINANNRDLQILNVIGYNAASTGSNRTVRGLWLDADDAGGGCFNNTIYGISGDGSGAGIGIHITSDDTDGNIKNNIAMGSVTNPTDFLFAGATNVVSMNNMSSDATADDGGGTGHLISKTAANQFVSTTAGSEDFHLKSGADAIDAGVDLGTTPTGVNFDIDNRDRDALGDVWDIGADEFVAAGGGGQPMLLRRTRYGQGAIQAPGWRFANSG